MAEAAKLPLDESARLLLLEQFAVEQFLLGLSLVDRFLLDVLVVPSARVARLMLALMHEELPKRRGEALRVRELGSTPARAASLDPLDGNALLDDILVPLMQPTEAVEGALTVTWIDASTARPVDEPAWTGFFHRLNERRNAMADIQPGPLVVALPPRLESVFAHAAPDVWSIRSGVYRVQISDLETYDLIVATERHPSLVKSAPRNAAPRHVSFAFGLLGEAPARFDDVARSWAFAESVSNMLGRGDLDAAAAAAEQALHRARVALATEPDSPPALRGLVRALKASIEVDGILGEPTHQREKHRLEQLQAITRLIGVDAPTDERLMLRAEALRAASFTHDKTRALEFARAAVEDSRELYRRDSRSREISHLLGSCLLRLGQTEREHDALAEAREHMDEAEAVFGGLGESLLIAAHSLSLGLLDLYRERSSLRQSVGWVEGATEDAERCLDLAKRAVSFAPNHPEVLVRLARARLQIASVLHTRGDLPRAAAHLQEAVAVMNRFTQWWPRSRMGAYWLVVILRVAATIAQERGELDDASGWRADAFEVARALLAHRADDEDVQKELDALLALEASITSADHGVLSAGRGDASTKNPSSSDPT